MQGFPLVRPLAGGLALAMAATQAGGIYNVVSHGDSITADLGSENYSFKLQTLLGSTLTQVGTNGSSYDYQWDDPVYAPGTTTMIQEAAALVDSQIIPGKTNILVVFAGTNGLVLAGHSVATEYGDLVEYVGARVAAGWLPQNIYVVDMLPRTGVAYSVNTQLNELFSAGRITYGYNMVRLRYTEIGASGADLDTDLFYDGTHPTAAGHTIIAQEIYDTINPEAISDSSLAVLALAGETSGFALFAEDDSCMVKDSVNPYRNFRGKASVYLPTLPRQLDGAAYRYRLTASDQYHFPMHDLVWNDAASTVMSRVQAISFPTTDCNPVSFSPLLANVPGNITRFNTGGSALLYSASGEVFKYAAYVGNPTDPHTLAVRWATNNAAICADGQTPEEDNACAMETGLDTVWLGRAPGGLEAANLWIDCLVVLPRAASNAELQAWNP